MDMPDEVIDQIVQELDADSSSRGQSLCRLGRTCWRLHHAIQKPLFHTVSLGLQEAGPVESLVAGMALFKERSSARSLRVYTKYLFLDAGPPNRKLSAKLPFSMASPRKVAAVVAACSSPDLCLNITFDPCYNFAYSEMLSQFLSHSTFTCHSLTVQRCPWSIAESLLAKMRRRLTSFTWYAHRTDSPIMPQWINLWDLQFGKLQYLEFDFARGGDVEYENALKVIKFLDRQLLYLELHDDMFGNERNIGELPDWEFPILQDFICSDLPVAIYKKVLARSPGLKSLRVSSLKSVKSSLLAMVPLNVQYLKITDLKLDYEPLDSVSGRICELKHLRACPTLWYRRVEGDDMSVSRFQLQLTRVRSSVSNHLTDLGVIANESILQNCIRLYRDGNRFLDQEGAIATSMAGSSP